MEIWVLAGLFMGNQIGLSFPTQEQCEQRKAIYEVQANRMKNDPVERRAEAVLTCTRFTGVPDAK